MTSATPWLGTSRQCTATSRAGERCRRAAMRGGSVCAMHGGRAPAVKRAAARRTAEAEIRREVDRMRADGTWTGQPIENPLAALSELAGEIRGWQDLLRAKVEKLDAYIYETASSDMTGGLMVEEKTKAAVELYERALDRAVKVLGVLARAGVEDKLAAVTARQADILAGLVLAAIADVSMPPEQAEPFRDALARRTRELVPAGT